MLVPDAYFLTLAACPRAQAQVKEDVVPAKSKKQQMAAGAALAAKRGKRSKASLKGASRQMVESMSEKQLEEFASTKRRRLPTKRRG
jgi:type IV secretory pathway VirB10-like protein